MHNVGNKIERVHVHVYLDILEIHTMAVDRNVLLILIVRLTKLVSTINALIHALELVDKMQIVK